jgi:hypothetical protein
LSVVNPVSLPAGSTLNGTAFGFRIAAEDSTNTAIANGSTLEIRGDQGIQTRLVGGALYVSADITALRPSIRNDSTPAYITFVGNTSAASYIGTDTTLRYTASTGVLEALNLTTNAITSTSITTTDLLVGNVTATNQLTLTSNLNDGTGSSRLVSVGSTLTDGRFQIINGTYSSNLALANIIQSHATADARNFQFNRSRGTTASPTAAQSGDDIIDIAFGGHDGTSYQVRAAIAATVDGSVSAGVVPTKIDFLTGTTATGVAVSIGSNRQTTFNGAITLAVYADATARDAAITAPTGGMMVYLSGPGKFTGYNGFTSGWNDLN